MDQPSLTYRPDTDLSTDGMTKGRKRKIDKDGFVCPTTPDIPKTSSHYMEDTFKLQFDIPERDLENEELYHAYNDPDGQEQTDRENVSGYFSQPSQLEPQQLDYPQHDPQHGPQHDEDYTTDYNNNDPEFVTNNADFSAVTEGYTNTADVNSEDNDVPTLSATGDASHITDGHSSLNYMIKGFMQESNMLCEQWSKIFRQSEDFEKYCPNKLDLYISAATSLEDTLNRQKDVLCGRVKGIGQTLIME